VPQQTILDHRQQGLNLPLPPALQSMVELERQRIESFNKRTDVARYAIEANDAADRRQFEYQMAKLAADKEATERRECARTIAGWQPLRPVKRMPRLRRVR